MTAAPESHVSSEEAPSSSPSSNNNNNNTKKSKGMSKRQRRKAGPNPINTLPQQPKIKTMDARNKAYLRQAGFTSSSTNKSKDKKKSEDSNPLDPRRELFPEEDTVSSLNTSKNQPWIISSSSHTKKKQRTTNDTDTATATATATPATTTTKEEQSQDPNSTAEMKFGRLLASPDAKIRHKTLLKLQAYIKAKCAPPPPPANDADENDSNAASSSSSPVKGFSHLDLMKLWKALWHTLYLSDGVVVQEEVSKVLAELLWCFAGTPEEDEYVSRLYLEMEEANENSMEVGDDDDDDNDEEAPVLVDCGDANDDELDEKLIREIREKLKDVEEVSMEDSDDEDEEGMSSSEEIEDAAAAAAAVDGAIRNDEEVDGNDDDVDMENDKHCRGAHLAALYFRTYLITLTREWPNMDKYRIDKFYTLTRMMLREVYRYMAKRHWTLGVVHIFNDALMEEVLQTNKTGNGIRFHIIDICLEELANVNSEDDVTTLKLTEAIILDVLQPYLSLAQLVEEAIVHKKVMDKVLTRFLEEYSVVSSNYDPENTDGDSNKLIMDQVHVGTVAQFIFSLAGDSVTLDWHRKKLYNMHKDYVRKIKTVGRDVCLEEEGDDDDMDVVDDEVEEKKDTTEKVDTVDVILSESSSSKQPATEKAELSPSNVKAEEEVQTESNSAKKKKSKKSKKKKSKHASSKAETSTPSDIPTDSISPPEQQESEDVITISVQDQKKAKKASALRKSKKAEKESKQRHEDDGPSTPPDDTPGDSRVKKVKFSRTNRAKSHNKSMKDLRKVDAKATLERTPEKSILLSKKTKEEDGFETPVADGKKKKRKGTPHPKKRKHAIDFF